MNRQFLVIFCSAGLALSTLPGIAAKTEAKLPICDSIAVSAAQSAPKQRATLAPISLPANKAGKTAVQNAQALGIAPRSLIAGPDESDQEHRLSLDCRKQQLLELWDATIEHSQAIQFVVARLQPNSDHKKSASNAVRSIGQLIVNAGQQTVMMAPGSSFSKMGSSAAIGVLAGLLGKTTSNNQRGAGISEETATFLYFEIQRIADNLAVCYRTYRMDLDRFDSRVDHFESLKAVVNQIADKLSPVDQVRYFYELTSARREAEEARAELILAEDQLAEYAGSDAIRRMKVQIAEEREGLIKLCGGTPPKLGDVLPKVQSAQRQP